MIELAGLVALGFVAGLIAGLFGVGGGIVFVPALAIIVGMGQLEAQATSLVAIIPVAIAGAWNQGRYGNLRLKAGLLLGVLASAGAFAGVAVANAVSERVLEVCFAGLALASAVQLARRALWPPEDNEREERPWT